MSSWEVSSAWQAALAVRPNERGQIFRCLLELTLDQFAVSVVRDPRYAKAAESIGARVVEHDEAVAKYEELSKTKWRRGKPPKPPRRDKFPQVEVSRSAESIERFVQLLVHAASRSGASSETLEGVHAPAPRRGRPPGSFVKKETFWRVWQMVLDGKSGREIERLTRDDPSLELVNREKASVITKAVDANPRAARQFLRDREIPPNFSATSYDGTVLVKLPLPKR